MTGDSFNHNIHAVCLFVLSWRFGIWYKSAKKPLLLMPERLNSDKPSVITSNRIDHLLAKCPSLHAVYYPSFLWINPHLQLIPFMLNCHIQEYYLRPFEWMSELATLADGEVVALDWVGRVPTADSRASTPVLMLHHGAGGRSTDLPGQTYVREALRRGWLVCALNRRGHKPGLSLTRERWNFFGCPEDLRCVVRELVRKKRPRARLFMLGISAGSGLVARFMGEQGERRRAGSGDFLSSFCDGAVGVCPGFDVERCMGNFGPPYSQGLLHLQKQFLRRHEAGFGDKQSFGAALAAEDLQGWLNCMWSVAHEHYRSAEDYYEAHNPMRVTRFIHEPCLFINSEDDPLCVPLNISQAREQGLLRHDMNAALAVTKTGSHCCFFELGTRLLHTSNWAERASFEFFDAIVASSIDDSSQQ